MVNVIVELSKYLIVLLMVLFTFQCFRIFKKTDESDKKFILRKQVVFLTFMNLVAFSVMYMQTFEFKMVVMFAELTIYIVVTQVLYRIFYKKASMLLMNNMCMLLSCGFIILARLDFEKAQKQFMLVVAGTVISLIVPVIIRKVKLLKDLTWVYAIAGILMLLVVLVLATATRGANLSIMVGGISFQLSEVVKITFVFFVAGMLRDDTSLRRVIITTALAATHVLILVVSTDLGNALVFFITYVVMLYVATRKPIYALAGLAGGSGAAVVAYYLFNHVRQRVLIWKDPFSVYEQAGYQIAQSLFAIGAGGWFGTGLFEGSPTMIPVVTKDFIFSAICEELGGVFSICMLLVCMSLFLMIVNISMQMSNKFYKLIALGLGAEYAFQVFLTVGGSSKFIPMTGITLPLVSYGGSSVVCTLIVIAIVQGLYILREDEGDELEKQKIGSSSQQKETRKRAKTASQPTASGPTEKSLEEKIAEQTEESLRW